MKRFGVPGVTLAFVTSFFNTPRGSFEATCQLVGYSRYKFCSRDSHCLTAAGPACPSTVGGSAALTASGSAVTITRATSKRMSGLRMSRASPGLLRTSVHRRSHRRTARTPGGIIHLYNEQISAGPQAAPLRDALPTSGGRPRRRGDAVGGRPALD